MQPSGAAEEASINLTMYPPAVAQYLSSLNEQQLAVAAASEGPYVVAGAPGSGKTRAVVARVARLICDGLAPHFILAMTFTRNAAAEMSARLVSLGLSGARVGTIHSVCREILAKETSLLSEYTVDQRNRLDIELRKLLGTYRKRGKLPPFGVDREGVEKFVSSCKANGICYIDGDPFELNIYAPDHLLREAQRWSSAAGIKPSVLFEFYTDLERARTAAGLMDFDDMLLWAWSLLVADERTLNEWRNRWSVVIVDEAQDSSPIQWDLSCLLVGYPSSLKSASELPAPPKKSDRHHSVMMAGDSSQSIYAFRHASPELYVRFSKQPETTLLTLPVNYRSTPEICSASTQLVAGKEWHLVGKIIPHSTVPSPGSIKVESFGSPDAEVAAAVQRCMELSEGGGGLRSCAILARMSASLHLAEIECIRKRIKYIKMAPGSFLESVAVQTVLNYLRASSGYDPAGQAIRAIINRPYRSISNASIDEAARDAACAGVSLIDALTDRSRDMSFRQRQQIKRLYDLLVELNGIARGSDTPVMQTPAQDPNAEEEKTEMHAEEELARLAVSAPARMISKMLLSTRYIEELRREEGLHSHDDSKVLLLAELQRIAEMFRDVGEFLGYIDALHIAIKKAGRDGLRTDKDDADALALSTIHRCVHPDTLLETDRGLERAGTVAEELSASIVTTADGPKRFDKGVKYPDGPLLHIITEGGYSKKVTPDHGVMAWDGEAYSEFRADQLDEGMWLRLRLPDEECPLVLVPAHKLQELPPLPEGDVRAREWTTPQWCCVQMAELLGMLVADGTVWRMGFRFVKRYKSSVDRFANLCESLFTYRPEVTRSTDCNAWSAEVDSTRLAAWLLLIGGMGPNAKAVPKVVLRSPEQIRCAFLRGLFEDGTVNVRDGGVVDHVSLTNIGEHLIEVVQLLLLQQGITSRRFRSTHAWRVDISGLQALAFARRIGFSCSEKQRTLEQGVYRRTDRMRSVPVSKSEARKLNNPCSINNARSRGMLSRHMAEQEPILTDRLRFHHVRIKEIRLTHGPSVCIEVPCYGRFLQNGFDGCNSKGLEWDHIRVIDVTKGRFPNARARSYDEELRLFYVAVTRARKSCVVSHSGSSDEEDTSEFVLQLADILRKEKTPCEG